MIESLGGAELLAAVAEHVAAWPTPARRAHKFDLLCGEPTELARRRRFHARRILVAEAALEELIRFFLVENQTFFSLQRRKVRKGNFNNSEDRRNIMQDSNV